MYIARQPIFNKEMNIYGYELLFRSDINSTTFGGASSTAATATVFGGLFEEGFEKITGDRKAFINFDYDFLMSDNIELIDNDSLIIEVLENVRADEKLLKRLNVLKKSGYRIALDDFEENDMTRPFIPIADIIKYDIIQTPLDEIENLVQKAIKNKKIVLAEKIETYEEFNKAKEMGFHLFQGYFFSKPKIISKTRAKNSSREQYIKILNELNQEEPSFDGITRIIESSVALTYRLLKVANNKNTSETFSSIKKTLMMMGLKEIERWVSIIMMQDFSKDKPIELLRQTLLRHKFSEFIARESILAKKEEEASLMCMLSMLDVIFEQPIKEALEGLFLPADVYDALVNKKGELVNICNIILAYEKADWETAAYYCDKIKLDKDILAESYLISAHWAENELKYLEC